MFITNAYAQSAASGFSLDSIGSFLPILLMFVLLYFLMIRPQQKKQREQRDMLSALSAGDESSQRVVLSEKSRKYPRTLSHWKFLRERKSSSQKASIVSLLPNGTIETLWPRHDIATVFLPASDQCIPTLNHESLPTLEIPPYRCRHSGSASFTPCRTFSGNRLPFKSAAYGLLSRSIHKWWIR